jgi:hypothetical protein
VTRRVINDVSHWPENGGVLRGSGRGGLRVKHLGLGIKALRFEV